MSTRKVQLQPTVRLNLETLEDRLAASNMIPYLSFTPPILIKRIVMRSKLLPMS